MMRLRGWVSTALGTRRAYVLTTIIVSALAALGLALSRGQDFNWDQRNYHLSTPHLLLQGDFWASVAPSGIQSFYNPALLVAQFLLFSGLKPMLAAGVLALCQSAVFVLAGLVCARLAPPEPDSPGYTAAFLGFMLCLASPMALSEIGTSFIDLLTAIPVLLGWLLLTRRRPGWGLALAGGLLLGFATGLKLTNAMYVLGAAGFVLAWPRPVLPALATGAGILAGFAAAAGYWHAKVWQRFGNPFFPYYNNLFGSPDAPAVSLVDARFPASSVWDIVRFPWFWLVGGSPRPGLLSPTSEVTLHDARFALALGGGVAVLACWRWTRRRDDAGLLLACLITYLVWLFQFGIHRYVVGLEVLLGAALLALCWRIPRRSWRHAALAVACVVTLARFHVPNWGHLPWAAHWQGIASPEVTLPPGSLVFLVGKPVGYVASGLCCDLRVVGLSGEFDLARSANTSLSHQLAASLDAAPGALVAFTGDLPGDAAAILSSYGLALTPRCRQLQPANIAFSLCELAR
jgi:hypothetical protein